MLHPDVFEAAQAELDLLQRRRRYITDPVLWAKDKLGVHLWSKQKEIICSVRDNRKTAVAAGHGVGKSFIAAVAMAWWVDVHPIGVDDSGTPQTFVASTAPFSEQISAILWNNLRILHALAKRRFEQGLIDSPLPGYITGDNKWKTDDGLLIGQGRKPPDSKADSGYQGIHAKYLLAIGDEAAGLDKDMVEALGNITTAEHNRMLLIANPTDPNSEMAKIWKQNLKGWKRMNISVFDSPKITHEDDFPEHLLAALSGMEYVDEMRDKWGENDPHYVTRVLGQWAFDAGNNLFTDVDIARGVNTVVLPDPDAKPQHGWDVARMGADSTVGYRALWGNVWEVDAETGKPTIPTDRVGVQLRRIGSWVKTPITSGDPANPGTVQRIDLLAKGEGADFVKVDATGLGQGVIDGLLDVCGDSYQVFEVYGGAASTDKRAYINMRAEQYFQLKRRLYAGEIDLDPSDEELLDELRGVVYELAEGGANKIESKESMKKRGAKSPDYADAAWYAALDLNPVREHPLGGLRPGEQVTVDPWELLNAAKNRPGMPM